MSDVVDLRMVIVEACEAALAAGFQVWPGLFMDEAALPKKRCCPMGAVVHAVLPTFWADRSLGAVSTSAWATAASVLGVDDEWVKAFVAGFDDRVVPDAAELEPHLASVYELGFEMRQRYMGAR